MIELKRLSKNETEIIIDDRIILVSYETLVAAFIPSFGYIRSTQTFSITTEKHITKWVGRNKLKYVDQYVLEQLHKYSI